MTDKRKFTRYPCKIKTKFEYYEGDPEKIEIGKTIPKKGKGSIMDISKGGLFVVTDNNLSAGNPIKINFSTKKNKYNINSKIIRVGLLKNNPSEIAVKLSRVSDKEEHYLAIEFNVPLTKISEDEI